ncbi:MAG: pyridoxamine kinase [Clostridioides sp.]|jgi:pyridoxine kinase|nr:pyridoxamine kinase [Clostridioides sp.]
MQKKVVAIHDISGLGKCSLTVAIPILSALKVQCCPFPTAVLSNQSEYPKYSFCDLTCEMKNYSNVWGELGFEFDSIYTGFLGSKEQVDIVLDFINVHKDSFIVVDPVMGDDGLMYTCFDEAMRAELKKLVSFSDMTTPNLTEALYLVGDSYENLDLSDSEILNVAKRVSILGPDKVIITGIKSGNCIYNLSYDATENEHYFSGKPFNGRSYSGTGDIFSSIVCGMLCRGFDFDISVNTASEFISKAIEYTSGFETDRNDGVMFEEFLGDLTSL